MNKNQQDELLNDIVAMLDNAVNSGTGHLNVTIDPDQVQDKTITTLGCTDCAGGNLACNIPTLHEGLEETENQ